MRILSKDLGLYGPEVLLVKRAKDCAIYKTRDESGEGFMTSFEVFPGIELIYNDFHMVGCMLNRITIPDIIEINHCRRGRFEGEFSSGNSVYIEEGDLSVNTMGNRTKRASFPLERYHGISVIIDLPVADRTLSSLNEYIPIDLPALRRNLCANEHCFVMKATNHIERLFGELYNVPGTAGSGYFKLKVLELLLFLSTIDAENSARRSRYSSRNQVDIIRDMEAYMTSNLDRRFTLGELSCRFGIPLTSMKIYFKKTYGTSVYAYMRSYRMRRAASMLRQSRENVSDIAGKVGYSNVSKFSCAFRNIIGSSPLEYRKSIRPIGSKTGLAE